MESVIEFLPYSDQLSFPDLWLPGFIDKKKWIESSIPSVLIELFGIRTLLDVPFMPWKDEYMGFTGYIDRIARMDEPVMMGKDVYDRAFIAIRTRLEGKDQITVLFQRYSDNKGTWTYGTRHHPCWMSRFLYFCQNNKIPNEAFRPALKATLDSII
jgi:hypothetical protein